MLVPDPWSHLRPLTPARIALGRAGGSLPTAQWLEFARDHALARDAVHAPLDTAQLIAELGPLFAHSASQPASPSAILSLATRAANRRDYLLRPDWGRQLEDASAGQLDTLASRATARFDLAIIVSDGLSAFAAHRQVLPLLQHLLPLLDQAGWRLAPLLVVPFARVAVQDDIGERLRARAALILLGERPGLLSPDSLGAYLVWGPRRGRTDADRNCVSNIRPEGLPHAIAARTLARLLNEARRLEFSGVQLKDEGDPDLLASPAASLNSPPAGSSNVSNPAGPLPRLPLLGAVSPVTLAPSASTASTAPATPPVTSPASPP